MEEEKKDVQETSGQPINDEDIGKVAGGYVGSDKYTIEEYSRAGVTWEHNTWSKDRYFFRGEKINQACAEDVTDFFFKHGRQCTDAEFDLLKRLH